MTSIDDIIIKPGNIHVFWEKQGSLFWPKTYSYKSSDGIILRSKEECEWHYILSKNGIPHTYEPDLKQTKKRPDFGIANNFLMEICGMVNTPLHKRDDAQRKKEYKDSMDEKRKIFNDLGYNLIEIYSEELIINTSAIRDVDFIPFILDTIKKYNPQACQHAPKIVNFRKTA